MREFTLQIVTPDGVAFSGKAESLLVTTSEGDTELLAGHADYIAAVGTGRARIRVDGKDSFASISRGMLTVKGGEVTLAAVTFEFSENIDLSRALRAKESAEERLKAASDDRDIAIAKAKLERAISRIKVAELK